MLGFENLKGKVFMMTDFCGEEIRLFSLFMQKQAALRTEKLLETMEELYLWAHGWRKLRHDLWAPPDDYPYKKGKQSYRMGHALNSQKYRQYNWRRYG